MSATDSSVNIMNQRDQGKLKIFKDRRLHYLNTKPLKEYFKEGDEDL